MDMIACDGCGRPVVTNDGPGMMAALKGPCPSCGGRFALLSDPLPGYGKRSRASQVTGKLGEDRQVGVQAHAVDPTDA
jgi:hypothetical protein